MKKATNKKNRTKKKEKKKLFVTLFHCVHLSMLSLKRAAQLVESLFFLFFFYRGEIKEEKKCAAHGTFCRV